MEMRIFIILTRILLIGSYKLLIQNQKIMVLDVLQINNVQNRRLGNYYSSWFQMYFKSIMFRTPLMFISKSQLFQMYFKSIMFRTTYHKISLPPQFQMYFKSIMFRTRLLCIHVIPPFQMYFKSIMFRIWEDVLELQ